MYVKESVYIYVTEKMKPLGGFQMTDDSLGELR